MGLRERLPGPGEIARIREKAKRHWARAGVFSESVHIQRRGKEWKYYADFDYLIQDPSSCEHIVTLFADKAAEIAKAKLVDLLAFIEKANGGTVGALALEGAISIYTHMPSIPIRLTRELHFERAKISQEKGVPANQRLRGHKVVILTDHISSGGEALKAVDAVRALGGEVTDIICYTAFPDEIRWEDFKDIDIHYLFALPEDVPADIGPTITQGALSVHEVEV